MGRNNRERREAKKRARERTHRERSEPAAGSATGSDLRYDLRELAASTVQVWSRDGHAELRRALALMVSRWGAHDVAAVYDELSDRLLDRTWNAGWQPREVVHYVSRRCGKGVREAVEEAIVAQSRTYRRGPHVEAEWMVQLDEFGTRNQPRKGYTLVERVGRPAWRGTDSFAEVVTFLAVLSRSGSLPCLMPPPSKWGDPMGTRRAATSVDPKLLERVRALLAKAESTEFTEEAATFTAKAQELITRHALDRVALDAAGQEDAPIARRIGIDRPYVEAKAVLLGAVARANRCRSVLHDDIGMASLFGYPRELDAVELLFASLLVQATAAVTSMGSQRDVRGRSRTRSFRQSFFFGFADTIGERLTFAAHTVTSEITTDDGRLLPVLAARDQKVDDAVAAAFPRLRRMGTSVSNEGGYVAGRVAGELATLDIRSELQQRAS